MPGQVCKVFIVKRFREAAYALTSEERQAKLAQVDAARRECGGRLLVDAAARWSGYGVYGFGVEVFPDIESLQGHTEELEKLDWFDFIESESFVGTPWLLEEPQYENPIYQLQLIRGLTDAAVADPEGTKAALARSVGSADTSGIRRLLRLNCRWSREDYMLIQLFEWPDLAAQMKYTAAEEAMDWPRLVNQTHILGVKAPAR
jgi:hypothetical protein